MTRSCTRVLIALSLPLLSCSPKSPPEERASSSGSERVRPKLRPSLRVKPSRLWPGAPTSLFGEDFALCAKRHDAPIGCVGRLYWKVENDTGGRVLVGNTQRPAAFLGWEPEVFASGGTDFSYVRDGRLYHWRNEELPKQLSTKRSVVHVSSDAGVCFVTDDGAVQCQRDAVCKQADDAFAAIEPMPPAFTVSVDTGIACSLVDDGAVYCWGRLQADRSECDLAPKRVEALAPAVSVVAGYGKACALLPAGESWCWGNDLYGQSIMKEVGGLFVARPVRIRGPEDIVQLEGQGSSFVALTADGDVWTWGASQPAKIELPMPAIDVFDGFRTCALLQNHEIRCFTPMTQEVREGLDFESEDAWMYAKKYVWVEE